MKVEREHDGKHVIEEQRAESVLAGKQVGTKPQVFNSQNKVGPCAPCAHGECEHRAPKPSRDRANAFMKRMSQSNRHRWRSPWLCKLEATAQPLLLTPPPSHEDHASTLAYSFPPLSSHSSLQKWQPEAKRSMALSSGQLTKKLSQK